MVVSMFFIALTRWKEKMTRELIARNMAQAKADEKDGVRVVSAYWTLGEYNAIITLEAPDEKAALKTALARGDWAEVRLLAAVPAADASSLVD
jgi:uncharacterized protein with GYD domain